MKTLGDIKLSENDRRAIDAATRMLRERFPIDEIVLFGSKARGDDDAESDIDLLLLTSRPMDWRERDAMTSALFDIEMRFGVLFGTIDAAREDWQEGVYQVLPIRYEVDRDGVPV